MLSRLLYMADNWSYFAEGLTFSHLMELLGGGLVFDTSAILVTNSLWLLLVLFPLHLKEQPWYHQLCRILFVFINGLALVVNLCDAAYFPFTLRRTTTTVFSEFQNESNLGSIFLQEALRHWYFVIAGVFIIYGLWRLYRSPRLKASELSWWRYAIATTCSLLLAVPLTVAGIRGGFTTAVRPITISNAKQYIARPTEAALVLNTPFALYRTIGKDVFVVPEYFSSPAELEAVYSPIHTVATIDSIATIDTTAAIKKNVVVLIVESFGREYIGALNKTLENGQYKGYTPYVDELISKSITFSHSYCNGRKSIDGMPSILSSIPMFVEPFFLTPASMNRVSGIASLLADEGYQTAFFHGAQRGSMGFQAFANSTGFQEYYGREDYDADSRFGGDDDFDGMWAIWDEPFLQYYATKMSEMKEPFMTAVFTASSHHPYEIPEKYRNTYPEEGIIIHKCIRYTDMAIGKFFERASKEPWFKNTIFVLTSDHTNLSDHAYYQTDLGGFCSPIVIFDASGEQQPRMEDKIAQQIDILPTVMGMLHYQKPYFGFGIDLLNTPAEDTWAVNYMGGIYQYVKHGHVLQFDGQQTKAVYALTDSLMQHNLIGKVPQQQQMEKEVKAIIQQYMERMTQDRLQPNP
jgi:phosphoglycerol transferase MdoB-like AlkP superfamily enzyme